MRHLKYENYEGLLIKLSWKFCTSPEELDDMMSICREAFVKAAARHNPKKGKFTTQLHTYANRALIDEYRKKKTQRRNTFLNTSLDELMEFVNGDNSQEETSIIDESQNVERRTIFRQHIEGLSKEAQEVVSIIVKSPNELLGGSISLAPKYLRGELIRMLRRRKWKWNVIYDSIKEIKSAIQKFSLQ